MESKHRRKTSRNEDFQESDIWDTLMTREATALGYDQRGPYKGLLSKQLQGAARPIPKAHGTKLVHNSAPVKIPHRSKLNGKTPKESTAYHAWHNSTRNGLVGYARNDDGCHSDDYDDEDDKLYRLPPHEWLARKHMRNQTLSLSVCEGAGRTLKGRDLRSVRDAVLTKTGFM